MAVAAMVLGILSIYTKIVLLNGGWAFVLAGISVILGIIAITNKEGKTKSIKGMVITALILSGIVLLFSLMTIVPSIISGIFDIWTDMFRTMYWYY